jgi:hypothetical protein
MDIGNALKYSASSIYPQVKEYYYIYLPPNAYYAQFPNIRSPGLYSVDIVVVRRITLSPVTRTWHLALSQ